MAAQQMLNRIRGAGSPLANWLIVVLSHPVGKGPTWFMCHMSTLWGTKGDILNFLRRPREVSEITQNVPLNLRRLVLSRRPVLESKFAE